MRVFKFGGASVKDAAAVKNVANILADYKEEELVVVISAMGKTTNTLEDLVKAFFYKQEEIPLVLDRIKSYHNGIMDELFANRQHPVYDDIENCFVALEWELEGEPSYSYDHEYDQIVSLGEILSTKIVAAYLNEAGVPCQWLDARDLIKTDDSFREGKVNWDETETNIKNHIRFDKCNLYLTQGFIGCTSENFTTTLGREGSDYTAAIMAYSLNAKDVTIWKDVPGVLNADPKWFDNTVLLKELSYQDAIELTYYGATVIHPKTIKPLQNKHISLNVRSFLDHKAAGTTIGDFNYHSMTPSFIFKVNQILISISPRDFSFIVEENISTLFGIFAELNIKVHLLQNSALNFSVCIDNNEKAQGLIQRLKNDFRVLYNEGVELITIRHYDQPTIDRVTQDKKILLEQKSRNTAQLVVMPD